MNIRKWLISGILLSCFGSVSLISRANEVLSLHNYQTNTKESVNMEMLTLEGAKKYLPENDTVLRIFNAYAQKGNTPGLSLVSTLIDIRNAQSQDEKMVKLFNFKKMKDEFVDLDSLTGEAGALYIPQSESLLKLYDFYLKDSGSPIVAIDKTLKDARDVFIDVNKSELQK